jgi:hypothetical protein
MVFPIFNGRSSGSDLYNGATVPYYRPYFLGTFPELMGLKIGQKPMESVSPCIPGTAQGVQTSEVLQLPSGHLRLEMSRML